MKKAILLVDVKNCNFLIVNSNNKWCLPTLDKVDDINKISEKFYKKYKLNIDNISLISEDKYIIVKCNLISKTFDENKFAKGVLNEISLMVNNKTHKDIISNILVKIGFEMINDSFWLGVILTTEDNINDSTMKFLLSDFLIFFSSIFCHESLIYKFGAIKDDFDTTEKEISNIRNNYLKDCPLYDSKKSNKILKDMGINYDSTVYDSVLFFADNNLIDINSRTWKNREKEKFDLFGGLVLSPRRWIKNCYPQFDNYFEEIRKYYVDEFIKKFNYINIKYKSYSTHRLFHKSKITNNEKTYVLQRIGLLKTIYLISNTFGNGNFIGNSNDDNFSINFDNYLLKIKSTIIEMIWNDYNQNKVKLSFLKGILDNYPKEISDEFFRVNRKCRDNIHYGFYNELSKKDIDMLNKYQNKYIEYIIKTFEKEIDYNFGISYKLGLALAKIQYWANN